MNFDKSILFYRKLTREIFLQINEDYLAQRIDKTLEQLAADFKFVENGQLSYGEFIDLIGAFVGHLYRKGGLKRSLTQPQANAEAIYIVESGYQSPALDRLDHAFLDAQEHGISHIFSFLVSFVGDLTKQSHVSFVMKCNLNSLVWSDKVRGTKILLDDWKNFLPLQMQAEPAENYADQLPQLFKMISEINYQAERSFNRGLH